MEQGKVESLIEAICNTIIGFVINFTANLFVLPLIFHIDINMTGNLIAGLIFTMISVARSYILRRYFTNHIGEFSERMAAIWHRLRGR